MSKIRKLYYFDRKNAEEMISFLNNASYDAYIGHLIFNPLMPFHYLLPLWLKFLPESYVLKDKDDFKGLITVTPIKSNPKKIEIQKLFFEEGRYDDAAELVQYVVSKYKAMGAPSIIVKVDDYLPELLNMFVYGCGFSQISTEKLWRVNKFINEEYDKREFRAFKNSDSQIVANLYNDALLPHFRPLLGKEKGEFSENLFQGLSYYSEYKYIIEDKGSKTPVGCVIIRTPDNENFILDIIQNAGVDLNVNSILSYAVSRIKKRKKKFGLFVKSKLYTNTGEKYDECFTQNGFECVQSQVVLTNSSARVLKDTVKSGKYTILNNFIPSNGVPTSF